MATWRVNNSTALGGEVCAQWQANHAYTLGARVVCRVAYATTAARAFVYECTSAGTSHATTEPTWPTTVGNTVVDGGVTWMARSPSDGSWDNASCYLFYVTNHAAAAGDTIYIDDGHSEAGVGATMTLTMSATAGSPTKVYCVDKASDTLSTGAVVATGNHGLRLGGCAYSYGVNYNSGTGQIAFGRGVHTAWTLEGNNTTTLSCISSVGIEAYSTSFAALLYLINAKVYIGANRGFNAGNFGLIHWRGGSVETRDNSGTTCFCRNTSNNAHAIFEDVDLSDLGKGAYAAYLFDMAGATGVSMQFLRCKLPDDAGFVISQEDASYYNSGKVVLHHCSSANQTYDFYERSYEGTVEDSTSIYRTGGASDGTTALSAKMVSSAGCVENIIALESPPIHAWTGSTTSKTFTIEGLWDSATNIQDDEIWMELEYPANNTDGLGAVARDKCAILGTPADQTASSETWTTTGLTNPNKFKLSVTVTPGKAGPITARVYLAKASTTVYIDCKITES